MIRRRSLLRLAVIPVVVTAIPAVAAGQGKSKQQGPVSISASPNPTVHGTPVSVTTDVKGEKAGVTVTLQRRPSTGGAFETIASGTTNNAGRHTFSDRPSVNVYYRVLAATSPPRQSSDLLVRVRMLVGLRVSDTTPRRGSRVRFSGIVRPAHNGRTASVQKRASDGRWITVKRTVLAALDAETSRYSTRVRVRRSGSYRVRVIGHADHAMGISRTRTLTVH